MNDYVELTRQLWAYKHDRWTGAAKALPAQADTIERLEAENAALRADLLSVVPDVAAIVAAKDAQIDALRADADRGRKLADWLQCCGLLRTEFCTRSEERRVGKECW